MSVSVSKNRAVEIMTVLFFFVLVYNPPYNQSSALQILLRLPSVERSRSIPYRTTPPSPLRLIYKVFLYNTRRKFISSIFEFIINKT